MRQRRGRPSCQAALRGSRRRQAPAAVTAAAAPGMRGWAAFGLSSYVGSGCVLPASQPASQPAPPHVMPSSVLSGSPWPLLPSTARLSVSCLHACPLTFLSVLLTCLPCLPCHACLPAPQAKKYGDIGLSSVDHTVSCALNVRPPRGGTPLFVLLQAFPNRLPHAWQGSPKRLLLQHACICQTVCRFSHSLSSALSACPTACLGACLGWVQDTEWKDGQLKRVGAKPASIVINHVRPPHRRRRCCRRRRR